MDILCRNYNRLVQTLEYTQTCDFARSSRIQCDNELPFYLYIAAQFSIKKWPELAKSNQILSTCFPHISIPSTVNICRICSPKCLKKSTKGNLQKVVGNYFYQNILTDSTQAPPCYCMLKIRENKTTGEDRTIFHLLTYGKNRIGPFLLLCLILYIIVISD